jgi:hypothetical protein
VPVEQHSFVSIVIDYPDGYTVAGICLQSLGPFDDAADVTSVIQTALGERWGVVPARTVREYYADRYSERVERPTPWEQLRLV